MKREGRLRFAVRLAEADLTSPRSSLVRGLRRGLTDFLGLTGGKYTLRDMGGVVLMPLEAPFPQDYAIEHFRELQRDVRAVLAPFVAWRSEGFPPQGYRYTPLSVKFSLWPTDSVGVPGRATPCISGPTRDVFLFGLLSLYGQGSTEDIRRCGDDRCRRLYYREGRQRYCSPRCRNRVNQRKFKATPEGKLAAREAAHQHYVRKQRERGVTGKIARRPRATPRAK